MTLNEQFGFDGTALKPTGKQSLDELVSKLESVKYDRIVAIGYADSIGSDEYNRKLALRRAEAVRTYLVKEKGIPADKIFVGHEVKAGSVTADTCYKTRKKTKDLIKCLQPDRRVEVIVMGKEEVVE